MSLQALDKLSREKLSKWGSYVKLGYTTSCTYDSIIGCTELAYVHPYSLPRRDSLACSYEQYLAIKEYLVMIKERQISAALATRERREQAEAQAKAALKAAAKAEAEEKSRVQRLASFPKWAVAGFPIYDHCSVVTLQAMNPMPTLTYKGMWLPDGFSSAAELEEAFWTHLGPKGTCTSCGAKPKVMRRFTPPATFADPSPKSVEKEGLFSSCLGTIGNGVHWSLNLHTGHMTMGSMFELKPAKSGITLRCCDNNVSLDE
jgi:hypothetical protein